MNRSCVVATLFVLLRLPFDIAAAQSGPLESPPPVVRTVQIDGMLLYRVVDDDSARDEAHAVWIEQLLEEMRVAAAEPEAVQLREENGLGMVYLDSSRVLVVKPENRVRTELSPLGNALMIRQWLVEHAVTPPWGEEELLLRLLLGFVFPFSLIAILRMTRLGIRNWERRWRTAALQWLIKQAKRRGISDSIAYSKRLVRMFLSLERLVFFTGIVFLVSLSWFTLFPQTRTLATSLVDRVVGPALSLLGDTIHALLLIVYILLVLVLAYWLDNQLIRRRKISDVPEYLLDPVIYFPLRLAIWIIALFMVLFPFPGAPRIFALGILFLALITGLLAVRPIIEEISAGIWFSRHYQLKPGDRFKLGEEEYTLVSFHLTNLRALGGDQHRFIPYSRLLKSELILP